MAAASLAKSCPNPNVELFPSQPAQVLGSAVAFVGLESSAVVGLQKLDWMVSLASCWALSHA